MVSNFITAAEVIDIAFDNKNVLATKIPDIKIRIAEISWIKPVITPDLFGRLNRANSGLNSDEIALKTMLKEPLAFFAKFECLHDINVQTTNKGAQMPTTNFSEPASPKDREDQLNTAKRQGEVLLAEVIKYIEDEDNISKFSTYYKVANSVSNRVSNKGGIILPRVRYNKNEYDE